MSKNKNKLLKFLCFFLWNGSGRNKVTHPKGITHFPSWLQSLRTDGQYIQRVKTNLASPDPKNGIPPSPTKKVRRESFAHLRIFLTTGKKKEAWKSWIYSFNKSQLLLTQFVVTLVVHGYLHALTWPALWSVYERHIQRVNQGITLSLVTCRRMMMAQSFMSFYHTLFLHLFSTDEVWSSRMSKKNILSFALCISQVSSKRTINKITVITWTDCLGGSTKYSAQKIDLLF